MAFRILLVDRAGRGLLAITGAAREAGIDDLRIEACETLHEAVGRLVERPADLACVVEPADAGTEEAVMRLLCTAPECPVLPLPANGGRADGAPDGGGDGLLARTLARLYRHGQDQRRLVYRATHDPLTGLANRWLLEEKTADAVARARRHRTKGALIFVDLDGFKAVNDCFGHDAGDLVLRATAARLRDTLRESDTVARYGGDEFVVLVEDLRGDRAALAVAEKLGERLAEPVQLPHGTIVISGSIGLAFFPDQGEDLDSLLRRADRLMYRRKSDRRAVWA